MSQTATSRRENVIFQVAAYIIIAAAGLVGYNLATSTTQLLVIGCLLLAIAVILTFMPKAGVAPWKYHLYLLVQGSLIAALLFVMPGWTMFPVLYCFLSVQAILLLPLRQGILWIVAFTLVTAVSFGVGGGWDEALYALFVYGGANAFFGAFAYALVRADAARQQSQALLAELQDTHQQLQEYAMQVEELAAVEERNRLAREMHDTLGHRLTVAAVQLEGAQRLCALDQEKAASMVGTVRDQVRDALRELRHTVATLRTPIEADLQLRSSVQRLVTYFEDATGLTVHRVLPDAMPDLPESYRLALYRATQEALTNVQKHAGASQVWLVLAFSDAAITLTVSDNGRGVIRGSEQTGFGLRGLRERAGQLGGDLYVEPRKGGGTELSFRLPLPVAEVPKEVGHRQGTERSTDG
jgi:signal transduction histidine kinase